MTRIIPWSYDDMDLFTKACLSAAVSGYPLAKGYFTIADLSVSATEVLWQDCKLFQKQQEQALYATNHDKGAALTRAGTEFWMVRNDSRLSFPNNIWAFPLNRILSNAARAMGAVRLYVNPDDGLIYLDGVPV